MNLIIDIGNSLTKLACFEDNKIIELSQQSRLEKKNIYELVARYNSMNSLIISSVQHIANDDYQEIFRQFNKTIFLNSDTELPIENLYQSKKTLGYDRIAAVVGANSIFPNQNILVIDAGTAITFDFINSKSQYIGGNISPGLNMRFRALNNFTGKLPLLSAKENFNLIGNSTEEAIISGVQNGMIFEIKSYIYKLKKKYSDIKVILTGGDSFFFEKSLKNLIFAESNLVLIGLNKILDFND